MKKFLKKMMVWTLLVCLLGMHIPAKEMKAATFNDINSSGVFLKQEGNTTCTLCASAMMLRRTAMLRGDSNWSSITESAVRPTAWINGQGLRWNFTYSNIKVNHASLTGTESSKKSQLIALLEKHPEGIVLYYSSSKPHAVLLTDYTNGTFYCADPYGGKPKGRIPLSQCLYVTVANANNYWYVSSPTSHLQTEPIPPAGHAPEGVVDNASGGGNNITVSGWAFDRDDVSRPVDIHVYIGGPAGSGAEAHAITANKDRTDVGDVYGVGNYHGYRETIEVETTGEQTLYFYAINIGEGDNPLLGTKTVTIKKRPEGVADRASGGIQSVTVSGWAYDPDEPYKAIPVHVYIGGPAGSGAACYVINANQERKDVGSQFGVGDYHGYSETISTNLVGEQQLYFYAIDSEGLGTTYLGSKTVEIQPELEPEGFVDSAVGGTDSIIIGGWAYDPNDYTQSLDVHVYAGGPASSGTLLGGVKANKERKDVGAGGKGDYHGFSDMIKTNLSGTQTLYFYAIGINGRTNPLIATKTVEITRGHAPEGSFDRAYGGKGSIRVTGWAFDRDAFTRSVSLQVYIGGPAGSGASCYQIVADKERTDVGDEYSGAGNYHGYDETIVTGKRGEQEIYIYAADMESNQGNTLLGHQTVTIQEAETESGHVHHYTEKITKQATCTKEGEKQYVCSCGDSYTEKTEKTPHNAIVEEERPATCVTVGTSEWSYCSECGIVLKPLEIMPKGGHKNTETRYRKEATCMEAGYTGDTYCTDCGMKLEEGTEIEQTDHDWDKGVILIEPTHTEKGIKTFTCKKCESSRVELIPVRTDSDETHIHNYTEEIVTPATCVEDGEIRYTCICGDTYTEMVERFGHEWDDGIVTKEPTETEAGERMFTCTVCKTRQTELIPPNEAEEDDTEGDGTGEETKGEESKEEEKVKEEIKEAEEEVFLSEGDIVYDEDRIAEYEVTAVNGNEIEVEYIEPVNQKAANVKIPDRIETEEGDSCKVTSISAGAFRNNKNITKIVVGNYVAVIGNKAFSGCKNLSAIELGRNVTKLGSNVFSGCSKIRKLTLPPKVSTVGSNAFYNCGQLKILTLKGRKLTAKGLAKKAFKGISSKAVIKVPKNKVTFYKKLLRHKGLNAKVKVTAL